MRFLGIPGLFVSVVLLTSSGAAAQTVSTQRTDYPSALGARGIAAADFNRDGWVDFATANEGPHGVSVLLNGGRNGGFTQSFMPLPGGPFDLASADLNKDGIPDIAVANADAHQIDLLFGVPEGGFSPGVAIPAQWNPRAITIADMDNDGNADLVFTLFQSNTVQVLHGDGRGGFAARSPATAVGPQPQGVVAVDLNADGRRDLAVANNGSTAMTILHQQADGSFARSDLVGYHTLNVLASGDFNNDGQPDIAAVSTPSSVVDVYLGSGGIVRYASTAPSGANPRGIAAADLNQDGKVDLITGNRLSSTVSVLAGIGDGTFAAATEFAAGSGSRTVAAADFDNDGLVDIASANENASSATVLHNSTTLVRAGFAFSRQVVGTRGNTYSGGSTVAIADFDHDGQTDLVTHQWPRGLLVLLGNGSSVALLTGQGFGDIDAADFTGDGHDDIVAAVPGSSASSGDVVWVIPGDGAGQFRGPAGTATNVQGTLLVVADLDRDGKRDLLGFGHSLADYRRGAVQPLLGRGDGTFTFVPEMVLSGDLASFDVGDVDRDGVGDFVAGYRHPATIEVYRGSGTGTFSQSSTVALPQWEYVGSLGLGDVNTDGYLDVVGTSAVYRPQGNPSFDFQLAVVAGGATGFGEPAYAPGPPLFDSQGHARLVDLNMDGRLDLMSPEGDLMLGNGDATFGEAQGFSLQNAVDLKFVDVDRDGLTDIVHTTSYGSADVILNRRQANNTPPSVDAGPDRSHNYEHQYGAYELMMRGEGEDADLHRLTYQWRDADGRPITTYEFGWMELPRKEPGDYDYTLTVTDGRGGTAEDTVRVTILPLKEIVIHFGNGWGREPWQILADGAAAGGNRAYDQNLGRAKVTTPVANPESFALVGFVADPTQEYKLWVRLRADGDHWSNDSLWLQFSDATDGAGNVVAKTGTTTGIEVNLEECSGCGVSGWGWRDEAWGQRDAIGVLTLRFPRGGYQTLQIQTREDGVSIDQVVLSAETYRTARPGAVKNDATILPRTVWDW